MLAAARVVFFSMGLLVLWGPLCGCGSDEAPIGDSQASGDGSDDGTGRPTEGPAQPRPQLVTPPFDVSGELQGLLVVWFDGEGTHTAEHRSDIPEAHRGQVRVDSLEVPPEEWLPADQVYVADLRTPSAKGGYSVHRYARAAFDALVDAAIDAAGPKPEDVVIYKADWCGVCKSAAAFLRAQKIPFIERDVEKDPGANEEMQRKAKAAGKTPRGVPVIDYHGSILLGFDREALISLIGQGNKSP